MTSFSVYNDKTFNVLTTNALNHDTLSGSGLTVGTDLGVGGNLSITGTATFAGNTTVTGSIVTSSLDIPGSSRFSVGLGGRIKFFAPLGPVGQGPVGGRLIAGASTYGQVASIYNDIVKALGPGLSGMNLLGP